MASPPKRIFIAVVLLAALAASALFTWLNPGEIALDFGVQLVTWPLGLAFVAAVAAGWLFGILSAALWVARVSADRRRLKAELRKATTGAEHVRLAVGDERD
jgi:uncharacterized integral membrane protein